MNDKPSAMPGSLVLVLGLYLMLLNLALLCILIRVWPDVLPPKDVRMALLPGGMLEFQLPVETRYFLIVSVAGALGSYIHLGTSFVDFVGNRRLALSWGWWYILRPFIGSTLALILYCLVRGGLITGSTGAGDLSPFGFAAIAGMAGMFSKQATDKLKEVFESLFVTKEPPDRADKLVKQPDVPQHRPVQDEGHGVITPSLQAGVGG
jgi:hypothetical protein